MAMPPLERHAAALSDPRFHRRSLATLLALQAEDELFSPAGDARAVAETAAAVASGLPRDAAAGARAPPGQRSKTQPTQFAAL